MVNPIISSTVKSPFENYFHWNYRILKISALWIPGKDQPSKRLASIFYTFAVLTALIIYQPMESGVIFFNPSLPVFLRSLRDQFNHLMCFYKLTRWFGYRLTILKLIDTLQDPIYNYDDFGFFDASKIVMFYKKQCDRWMLLFLAFVNMICSSMFFSVTYLFIFQHEEQYDTDKNGNLVYNQPFPVNLASPFPYDTMITFMLHFLFEIYCLVMQAWMIVGLDTLFTSLMGCVSAHLEILREAFKTIRPRCMKRLGMKYEEMLHDTNELQHEMTKEMKKCIQHLHMILDATDKMEAIYNLQTCGQVLTSLFEMCLCLFFLTSASTEDMGAELTYLVSTTFELLLYCWFGNAITAASEIVPTAIYEGDWLSSINDFKRDMLITMTRMKRPICMTIGKFTPLTFNTFLSIGKVAYSFYTVLKSDAFG